MRWEQEASEGQGGKGTLRPGPPGQDTQSEDGREDVPAERDFVCFVKACFSGFLYQLKGKYSLHTILVCARIDFPEPRLLILPSVFSITSRSERLHFSNSDSFLIRHPLPHLYQSGFSAQRSRLHHSMSDGIRGSQS